MDWSGFFSNSSETIGGFLESYSETRATNAVRRAQNKTAKITGAHNAGILSQHRMNLREESTSARMKLQRARSKAKGTAVVSAAVAGVQGGSVDATRFDIARAASERAFELESRAQAENLNIYEQEFQNRMNTALAQKTMLSGPSAFGLALGIVGDNINAQAADTGSDGTGVDDSTETKAPDKGLFNFL